MAKGTDVHEHWVNAKKWAYQVTLVEPQDEQDVDQGEEAQRDEKTAGKVTNSREVQGER